MPPSIAPNQRQEKLDLEQKEEVEKWTVAFRNQNNVTRQVEKLKGTKQYNVTHRDAKTEEEAVWKGLRVFKETPTAKRTELASPSPWKRQQDRRSLPLSRRTSDASSRTELASQFPGDASRSGVSFLGVPLPRRCSSGASTLRSNGSRQIRQSKKKKKKQYVARQRRNVP
ncbi:hypothetical protein NDU88_011341 [Pleurodeles waltl]|uniref:Uncharacterized protein n=1 Tax=Pleurodeles waltl TaxID=8319 RepID=A0AAV7QWY7_PLEWA|nr:hypothetical protein NDU88_011341 [Pleurodeles waltl]